MPPAAVAAESAAAAGGVRPLPSTEAAVAVAEPPTASPASAPPAIRRRSAGNSLRRPGRQPRRVRCWIAGAAKRWRGSSDRPAGAAAQCASGHRNPARHDAHAADGGAASLHCHAPAACRRQHAADANRHAGSPPRLPMRRSPTVCPRCLPVDEETPSSADSGDHADRSSPPPRRVPPSPQRCRKGSSGRSPRQPSCCRSRLP